MNLLSHAANRFLLIFLFSFFLQRYFIEVGFALKPFMILISIYLIFRINKVKIILAPYDFLLITAFFYFSSLGLFSVYPEMALRYTSGAVISLVSYFIIKDFLNKFDIETIEKLIILSYILFLAISFILYSIGIASTSGNIARGNYYGVMYERQMYRMIGTVTDPNFFVFYSTLPFFILLKRNKRNFYSISILTIAVLSIILSISRGGIFSLLFAIFAYKIFNLARLNPRKVKVNSRMFMNIGFYLLVIISTSLIVKRYNLIEVIQDVFSSRVDSIESGSGRTEVWTNALQLFYENPIFGIGLFNFSTYNTILFNDSHYMHNTHLEVLVENGIFGFFIYILLIFCILFVAFKTLKIDRKYDYLFFCGVAIFLQMFFLSALISEAFYLYLAFLAVVYNKVRKNIKPD